MIQTRKMLRSAFAMTALLVPGIAGATSVQRLSLGDLAVKSATIAVARVEDSSSRWDDGGKEIYTYITLRVTDPVKGAKRHDTITVRQIGGQVGSIASIVPGTPAFRAGEEVVVFLTAKDRSGHPWVLGLQQGKYSVVSDGRGGKRVSNELDGLTLVSPDGAAREGKPASGQPLELFLEAVRSELGSGGIQIDPIASDPR